VFRKNKFRHSDFIETVNKKRLPHAFEAASWLDSPVPALEKSPGQRNKYRFTGYILLSDKLLMKPLSVVFHVQEIDP
jgi:hypothetical protein